jgi:hypothetical protein
MWDGDLLTRVCPDCEARLGLGEGDLLTRDYPDCEERQGNSASFFREPVVSLYEA